MMKLSDASRFEQGKVQPIWIAAWQVLYLIEHIDGGTLIRLRDDVTRHVTEPPTQVALLIGARR